MFQTAPTSVVLQCSFGNGRPAAALVTHRFARPWTAPRASAPPGLRAQPRPPHPADWSRASAPRSPLPAQRRTASVQCAPLDQEMEAFAIPPTLLSVSDRRRASTLPPTVRRKMEHFFGEDLSDVRVHVGPEAPAIGALAFTMGSDIYFAPGQYDPITPRGQELLGHELTHVLQQREGRVHNPIGDQAAVVHDPSLEDEADRMGRIVSSRFVATSYRRELARDGVQRKADPTRAAVVTQRARGHEIVLGAYMHGDRSMPEPLAGHAFVALRDPSGRQEAFGFSPKEFSQYDLKTDLPRLESGVPGVVHDDAAAFEKPGVHLRRYTVSPQAWSAARKVIERYRSATFSLEDRQCTRFAADVAAAASIHEPVLRGAPVPRAVYEALDG
jgi:hypothetical protein